MVPSAYSLLQLLLQSTESLDSSLSTALTASHKTKRQIQNTSKEHQLNTNCVACKEKCLKSHKQVTMEMS